MRYWLADGGGGGGGGGGAMSWLGLVAAPIGRGWGVGGRRGFD